MENSVEVGQQADRQHVDSAVSMQDLVDSYMVPFQKCVEEGKVTSLMCSYNAVNGVPSCASDWLLTTVARGEWGFDGYITSDCDADSDVFNSHHFTDTAEESVEAVLKAGTDVDCGGFVQDNAQSALDKGLITEDDIDARLYYLWRIRLRMGLFDPPGPLNDIEKEKTVCTDYSVALARDGLVQSAVLLKNADDLLPLSAPAVPSLAVVGPLSVVSVNEAYYGPDTPCDTQGMFIDEGLREYERRSKRAPSEARA